MKSENIIELKNITKCYDDEVYAVDDFSLTVKKGEFVTFLGPSGCGKTTTLRMIAGFEMPTSGEILLNGEDISKLPPEKRPINTVFQKYALFPHMNIFDNIAFGLKLKTEEKEVVDKNGNKTVKKVKLSRKEIDKRVKNSLEIVDLEGFEKRSISTLSGGQQQRIAIARAIVNEPQILLLDEPLGALDLKMRKEMQLELKLMHEKLGITFVYVTHDQEEALTMSDKVVVMANGKIQQIGTPEKIYNEPKNAFVADFIGESNIFEGVMTGKMIVKFLSEEFLCLDDIPRGNAVDVVVRPEDIIMTSPYKGKVKGDVISCVFKGMNYEITVLSGDNEIVIQSTKSAKVGDTLGLDIEPDGIHVIVDNDLINIFDGVINKQNNVEFASGEFPCDVTMLYPNSHLDEKGFLITKDGEKLDLTDTQVTVEVPVDAISMSDDENEGGVCGNIINLIYKGDHYRYRVRTETEDDFLLNDEDLWNENDYVSMLIPSEKIVVKLK